MRFSNIRLSHYVGGVHVSPLDLPLDEFVTASPFFLKSVDGLGPPEIDVSIGESLNAGGVYQGRHVRNREVVMLIKFQPNHAVNQTSADLRSQLYRWLSPMFNAPVTLSVQDANRNTIATTTGHVKRLEASIFSREPEVQITFSCFSPYLMNWNQIHPSPSTISKNPISITNIGDAPSGFFMSLTLTAANTGFSLNELYNGSYYNTMLFVYNFLSGDIISFDTTPGKKAAQVTRNSVITNLLPYQGVGSKWLLLNGGVNQYQPNTQSFNINSLIVNANYWGV